MEYRLRPWVHAWWLLFCKKLHEPRVAVYIPQIKYIYLSGSHILLKMRRRFEVEFFINLLMFMSKISQLKMKFIL